MRHNHTVNPTFTIQKIGQLLMALALAMALAGCWNSKMSYDEPVDPGYKRWRWQEGKDQNYDRFKTSFIVDQIDRYYRGTSNGPIGVTTFVNLDDLYSTSTFGRMYAEQVMSELVLRGFDVVELRHSDALQFLASSGEFALSRDVAQVSPARDLAGVVVGTYVASPVRVYLNARLLDPTSSLVLSGGTVEIPKTHELARMLRGNTVNASLERIPVRHLGRNQLPLGLWGGSPYDQEESYYGAPNPPPFPHDVARSPEPKLDLPAALPPPPPPADGAAPVEPSHEGEHKGS